MVKRKQRHDTSWLHPNSASHSRYAQKQRQGFATKLKEMRKTNKGAAQHYRSEVKAGTIKFEHKPQNL